MVAPAAQRSSQGIQPDQRVPPGGRDAGDERPVGRLGHRLLAQHPIGSVELGFHGREGLRVFLGAEHDPTCQ